MTIPRRFNPGDRKVGWVKRSEPTGPIAPKRAIETHFHGSRGGTLECAKDTVEEKVLELQQTKRDLADAIINADNSLIRNLAKEDLELLLS